MFDVETSVRLWKHSGHGCLLGAVTFTADGQLLAFGGNTNIAVVLAAADGRVTQRRRVPSNTQAFVQAAISPDGTRLATAVGTAFRSYDISSGAKTLDLSLGTEWCDDIQYSPDGTRVATLADDGVRVWDAASGQQQMTLHPEATVDSMVFGHCGHVLVTTDEDRVVRVWVVATGTQHRQLRPAPETTAVSLSPDGRLALTSGDDRTLRIWDVIGECERTRPPAAVQFRGGASLSHDGTKLATVNGRLVGIWRIGVADDTIIGEPPQAGGCAWCGVG